MDEKKNTRDPIPCNVDGVIYRSRKDAAENFGKTPQLIYERMKNGKTLEEALKEDIKVEKIPVDLPGKHYKSLRAACKGEGIPFGTAISRINDGLPIEQVFAKEKQYKMKIKVFGTDFHSEKKACEFHGVNVKSVRSYMKRRSCSLEDAILHFKEEKKSP